MQIKQTSEKRKAKSEKRKAKSEKRKQTMFCKICFDSCRPDFESHNVRDRFGNVSCPVLKNTKCPKCCNFGHTAKYCKQEPVFVPRVVKSVKFNQETKMTYSNGGIEPKLNKNVFAVLCEDVNDEKEDVNYDDFFDLSLKQIGSGIGPLKMLGISWADACGY